MTYSLRPVPPPPLNRFEGTFVTDEIEWSTQDLSLVHENCLLLITPSVLRIISSCDLVGCASRKSTTSGFRRFIAVVPAEMRFVLAME